jgi:hypothetical protein
VINIAIYGKKWSFLPYEPFSVSAILCIAPVFGLLRLKEYLYQAIDMSIANLKTKPR